MQIILKILLSSVGLKFNLRTELDQCYLLAVLAIFFEKLLAESCTVFADFADMITRHGTTVVYDKTEMLLNLLKSSLFLE